MVDLQILPGSASSTWTVLGKPGLTSSRAPLLLVAALLRWIFVRHEEDYRRVAVMGFEPMSLPL